ncbi:YoaK family protein [Microbacterium sp. P06]|uniref:YoaK family protein n=1 Tax=Microbacterium sp. P06 TaxID=3366949 RepID=UPI003746A033
MCERVPALPAHPPPVVDLSDRCRSFGAEQHSTFVVAPLRCIAVSWVHLHPPSSAGSSSVSSSTVWSRSPQFPVLERAGSAVLLAVISGLLNAWTFQQASTFATVQSGNIVSLGYFLADGQYGRLVAAAVSIVAFAAGACVCSIVVLLFERAGASYSTPVLVAEAVVLIGLAALFSSSLLGPVAVAWAVSFLAGVQGNAFHRETGMLYGNVAVTFVLQMAASLVGRALGRRISNDGQPHLRPAGSYFVVLAGFALGGGIGFTFDRWWASTSLIAAAIALLALAAVALAQHGPVDPAQNAPTP